MSDGVPYFIWRDGRPRWSPGYHVRCKGFRGGDLKDEKGRWLPLGPALEQARALNAEASGTTPNTHLSEKPSRARRRVSRTTPDRGHVYFMRLDGCVKVGFSNNPARRARELSTAHSDRFEVMVAVRGTRHEEKLIHDLMEGCRRHGEWFDATDEMLDLIADCMRLRDITRALAEVERTRQNRPRTHMRPLGAVRPPN